MVVRVLATRVGRSYLQLKNKSYVQWRKIKIKKLKKKSYVQFEK